MSDTIGQVIERAQAKFAEYLRQPGLRGQTVRPQDSIEWWVAMEFEYDLRALLAERNSLRGEVAMLDRELHEQGISDPRAALTSPSAHPPPSDKEEQ